MFQCSLPRAQSSPACLIVDAACSCRSQLAPPEGDFWLTPSETGSGPARQIGYEDYHGGIVKRLRFRPGARTFAFYAAALFLIPLGEIAILFLADYIDRFLPDAFGFLYVILLWGWPIFAIVCIRRLSSRVRTWEQRVFQEVRDHTAAKIERQVFLTDSQQSLDPYFLYLRPFVSTGGLPLVTESKTSTTSKSLYISQPMFSSHDTTEDLETVLARTVLPDGMLLALGRPGEQIGAARIALDDETWIAHFRRLAEHARAIFLLPSTHPGTQLEIAEIFEREPWLKKTIFVIPPHKDKRKELTRIDRISRTYPIFRSRSSSRFTANVDRTYAESVSGILRALRIKSLPDPSNGLLLTISKRRTIIASRPITLYAAPWYAAVEWVFLLFNAAGSSTSRENLNVRRLRRSIRELLAGTVDLAFLSKSRVPGRGRRASA